MMKAEMISYPLQDNSLVALEIMCKAFCTLFVRFSTMYMYDYVDVEHFIIIKGPNMIIY